MLLFIAAFAFLAVYRLTPPGVVPASAPPAEFSAERAMKHLSVIADAPRPIGSSNHAEARDYILRELGAMGLSPEVQETTAVNPAWGLPFHAATVRNVVARLKGTGDGKAILLVGHYDSVSSSPGASDDGSGVALILETVRALKAAPALKNDIIFLFSDGEEVGLLGARAFVEEHPWAKDVKLVLNFEARGSGGPVIMFETSEQNGWLVREFGRAAPHPVANSMSYEIYRTLPHDTDLSVFKAAGLAGLNFAYIENPTHYHTQLDNTENIDRRSLQHGGSYATALTRSFGNSDLANTKEDNPVYFDVLGLTLVRYPRIFAIILTLLLALLFAGVVVHGLRRKRLSLSGILLAFLSFLVSAACASAAVALLWWIIRLLDRGEASTGGIVYSSNLYVGGLAALGFAVASAMLIGLGSKINVSNLTAGVLLWWLLLLLLANFFLPGVSYLFTWPLAFGLTGLAAIIFTGQAEQTVSLKVLIVLTIAAVLSILLLAPTIYLVATGLPLGLYTVIGVALMSVLIAGLLVPHLGCVDTPHKWLPPAVALALCLTLAAVGVFTSGYNREQPKPDTIFFGFDADTGKAVWVTHDAQPDEWTSQFLRGGAQAPLKEFFPFSRRQYLQSQATAGPLSAPEVSLLNTEQTGDGLKTLNLRVTSTRQAPLMSLYVDAGGDIIGSSVNGKRIDGPAPGPSSQFKNQWVLFYFATPAEGINITLTTRSSQPVKIRAVDATYGLPASTGVPVTPRPPDKMPGYNRYSDATLASRSFTF
jgi:MFS family permease